MSKKLNSEDIKERSFNYIKIAAGSVVSNLENLDQETLFFATCDQNHKFETSYSRLKRHSPSIGCPKCSDRGKLSIEEINKKCKAKNLEFNSKKYFGNKVVHEWKCLICNDVFSYSWNFIDREFIKCRNCKNVEALEKCRLVVSKKGGKLISTEYNGTASKIEIKCANNHYFKSKYGNIVYGDTWCAECSKNTLLSESICRKYFEQMFGDEFRSIRPSFLQKENGYNLELDGYSFKFNLAFEHNGKFHYPCSLYKESTGINDALKIKMCQDLGLHLIVIPQLFKLVKLKNLRQFIIDKCNILGIYIPFPDVEIDLLNCYINSDFDKYKKIAKDKKGLCLSSSYLGVTEKLLWQCEEGHMWNQSPYVIAKGSWCPVCAGYSKKTNKNIVKE